MKKIVLLALVSVLLSTATVVRFIRPVIAYGTIYIKADGSVEPSTAPISSFDSITYTFTDNIYDFIVVRRDNIVVDGSGYTLQGTWVGTGVNLTRRSNITIKNLKIRAFVSSIWLEDSSNNSIFGNDITASDDEGIMLYESPNNTISGNNITNNGLSIWLYESPNNTISGNNITNNNNGIYLYGSSNNSISGNNITNNNNGIVLYDSSSNNISGNNITNNEYGIMLYDSSDNFICHNFVDNTEQVYADTDSTNFWDDGYPSGGNYWSNYAGNDTYSGPYQNETGSDGIGDTPYVIYANNQDRYPLMISSVPVEEVPKEEVPFWMQWWFWAIAVTGIVALAGTVYFLKKRKPPTPTAPPPPTEGT